MGEVCVGLMTGPALGLPARARKRSRGRPVLVRVSRARSPRGTFVSHLIPA
jgi:hypothetical protein